jgi:hypothetical protein
VSINDDVGGGGDDGNADDDDNDAEEKKMVMNISKTKRRNMIPRCTTLALKKTSLNS